MPPPMPERSPSANERPPTSPRTPTATSSTTKPADCETRVTANVGRRRVSEPPEKSATPQTTDEPRASASASAFRSVQTLDEHRHSLPAADAHRLQPDRAVHRLQVVEQRAHDPRARHAIRMADRDRAAVRVQLVAERVDTDLAAHREDLRCERLVELHHVDVVDRH